MTTVDAVADARSRGRRRPDAGWGGRRRLARPLAGWPFARSGATVKTEDDPLDPTPAKGMRCTLDAIRDLEQAVTDADWTEGVVLRYGAFYGPGTSLDADGEHAGQIRRRKFPLVGDGSGVWSFLHIEDAAEATVAAVERGRRGIYNIVDDDPAAVAQWLPAVTPERPGACRAGLAGRSRARPRRS